MYMKKTETRFIELIMFTFLNDKIFFNNSMISSPYQPQPQFNLPNRKCLILAIVKPYDCKKKHQHECDNLFRTFCIEHIK